MEIERGLLGIRSLFGTAENQSLLSSTIPLPEGRDVSEVLLAEGCVDSAETACDTDAVTVTGIFRLHVILRSVAGEVYGFTAESNVRQEAPLDGVTPAMKAVASVQVPECRAEPDGTKLKLSAVIETAALVLAPVETPFVTDILNAPNIEKCRKTISVDRRVQLAGTSVRAREELDALDTARILLYRGAVQTDAVTRTGASMALASGTVTVTAIVETTGGDIAERIYPLPFRAELELPFAEDTSVSAGIESLNLSAQDIGFGILDAEASVRLTFYGREQTSVTALSDAYATDGAVTAVGERVMRAVYCGTEQRTVCVRENVSVPKHLPDASRAVAAAVMPVVTGTGAENGKLRVDAMLLTAILYRTGDGRLIGFTEDVPTVFELPASHGENAVVSLTALSAETGGTGRTLTLDCCLFASAVLYDGVETALVSDVLSGGGTCPHHGILIYCAEAGETVWDIGKRFSLPAQRVTAFNPTLNDPLHEGEQVLLMR